MAIYIKSRKQVADPNKPNSFGTIIEYITDYQADIEYLPTFKGSEGSTAFCLSNSGKYMLGSNGWVRINQNWLCRLFSKLFYKT